MKYYLTLIALLVGCGANEDLKPADVQLLMSNESISQYKPLELSTEFKASWKDPYNSNDVMTDLKIKTPSGKSLLLPGYFQSGTPGEASIWSFKLAPKEIGTYTVSSIAYDNGKLIGESQPTTFVSTASQSQGFIESNNIWSFKYSNGEVFRGIGENFGWEARDQDDSKYFKDLHEDKRFNYDTMLQKLSANGANIFRTWMIYWNLPIDWNTVKNSARYSDNKKRFNDSAVTRMNELVSLTEQYNIKMILSLDSHAGFDDFAWPFNSYNKTTNGPAKDQTDFFVNPEAKQRYKDKLRFMVANWSYSTGIAAWEFFNEVDNVMYNGYDRKIDDDIVVNWHAEMSEYLSKIDAHGHLITTSISHRDIEGLFDLEHIDLNQSHLYKVTDRIPEIINKFVSNHNKPYFAGEFSAEWDWSKNFDEFKGKMISDFKRGLWYGLFSPTPVMPLSWWWEYFDEHGTDTYFANVQKINRLMLEDGSLAKIEWAPNSNGLSEFAVQTKSKVFVYVVNTTETILSWSNLSQLKLSSVYNCDTGKIEVGHNQSLKLSSGENFVLIFEK
ncbi:hypothetical protein ACOI22_15055 [Glaciecola sp. 2405UD65-10]|uniref:hypothetical protein n=1 Tax=Glaciecola sp. 2405UD65-10 TaxID=3397244 RepID=UPI003B5B9A9D